MTRSKTSSARSVVTDLTPEPQSAPRARAVVREVLRGSRIESVLDAAELCVSELVTNAVLHAGTQIQLEVRYAASIVRLSVRDQSPNVPVLVRHTRTASTGRGLAMVAAVADAWGIDQHDGRGKTVWCELTERSASTPDLDIAAVVAAWELSTADDPLPVPDESARTDTTTSDVVLQGYPVRLGQRLQEHYEAVVRECQLLAAPRQDSLPGMPERLLVLAVTLAQRYTEELSDLARPDPRRVAAHAHGLAVIDLTYDVSPEQLLRLRTWQQILDDVDDFSRRGDLLAPAIPHTLALLRGWALDQFARQSQGSTADPWDGPLS